MLQDFQALVDDVPLVEKGGLADWFPAYNFLSTLCNDSLLDLTFTIAFSSIIMTLGWPAIAWRDDIRYRLLHRDAYVADYQAIGTSSTTVDPKLTLEVPPNPNAGREAGGSAHLAGRNTFSAPLAPRRMTPDKANFPTVPCFSPSTVSPE